MKKPVLLGLLALGTISIAGALVGVSQPHEADAATISESYTIVNDGVLNDGDVVLLAYIDDSNSKVFSGIESGNNYGSAISLGNAYADGAITIDDSVASAAKVEIGSLVSSDVTYRTLKLVDDGTYLSLNEDENHLNTSSQINDNCCWKLTFDTAEETFQITNMVQSNRNLRFNMNNANSPRVACYKDSSDHCYDPSLFVLSSTEAPTSIAISGTPKTAYFDSDEWDVSDLVVTATYDSGSSRTVTSSVEWSFNPARPDISVTSVTATATYTIGDVVLTDSLTFDVTVTADSVSSLAIKSLPNKTKYALNEVTDYDGIVVDATYASGRKTEISDTTLLTFDPAEGTQLSVAGEITVKVAYLGKEVTFLIEVGVAEIYAYTFADGDFTSHETFSRNDNHIFEAHYTWEKDVRFVNWDNSGKGIQFGSSNAPVDEVVLGADIVPGYKVTEVVVNASTTTSSSAEAYIKVGANNGTYLAEQKLTGNATDFTFTFEETQLGHIDIVITNKASRAVYLKSVVFYGVLDEDGLNSLAKRIEEYDVCSSDTSSLADIIGDYDSLSADNKAIIDAISLNDYQDGDTSHALAKTFGRLTVGEKIVVLRALYSASSSSNGAVGSTIAITFITIPALLVLAGATIVIIARKERRHNKAC